MRMNFSRLQSAIKDLPCAQYPALLSTLVQESYKAGTWNEGGASEFVKKLEERMKEKKA